MSETRIPMTRPYCLPRLGEPITLKAATVVVSAYGARVRHEVDQIHAELARSLEPSALTVRVWAADAVMRHWGPEFERARLAHITYDNIGDMVRFKFVDLFVDKVTGDLVVRDEHGLLAEERARDQ